MNIPLQQVIENDKVILYPLNLTDFEELYAVASDEEIWKQHPNKDRWKKEVFKVFFEGAIQSGGAFKITDKLTGKVIGSTRYYDYSPEGDSIFIGYTFFSTACWGKGYNHSVKTLMLGYIFRFVSTVYFHIGANNIRSQISISRIGAEKIGEEAVEYYGESPQLNFVYRISREGQKK